MAGVKLTLKRIYDKGHLCFELPNETEAREQLNRVLRSCQKNNGDYITVTLEKPFKPRTTGPYSQNHKLNGMIMQMCEETGNDYEIVKYCVKMIAVEELGYPYKEMDKHIFPKGEHDCSTEECSLLIEAAYLLAADLNIVLKEVEND